jgi:hypothetical protein
MITPKDRFDYLSRFVRRPLSEAREALINVRADELSVSDKALYAQITEAVNTLERKMRSLSEQWLKGKIDKK